MKLKQNQREVKVDIDIWDIAGPVKGLEDRIIARLEGKVCNDPVIESAWDDQLYVTGWRPATEKEIERSKKASERAKAAAAKRREQQMERELKEYERLRKKLNLDGI